MKLDSGEGFTSSVTFGEYDEIGGKFKDEVVLFGHSVIYINKVEDVCCGAVGSAGKVCVKSGVDCKVTSHISKSMSNDVESGLYIKGGAYDFFLEPCLPRKYLSINVLEDFLEHRFEDDAEVSRYFDFAQRLGEERGGPVDYFSTLEEFRVASEEALNAKTPAKKRKVSAVSSFEEVYQNVQDNYREVFMEAGNTELITAMKELFEFGIREQESARDESYILGQKLNAALQQIGNWPANSAAKAPHAIWLGIAELMEERSRMDTMESTLQTLGTAGLYQSSNQSRSQIPPPPRAPPPVGGGTCQLALNNERKILSVENRTRDGFIEMEAAIARVRGTPSFRSTQGTSSLAELGMGLNTVDTKMNRLLGEFGVLEKKVNNAKGGVKAKDSVVVLGSYSFGSLMELSAWCDKMFSGTIPFGVFVDCYTVLQRVVSFMDVADDSTLKDMATRKKVELSPDEATAVAAFDQPLPKLFRGSNRSPALALTWLPGIPTKERWEDDIGMGGTKITIAENVETVRTAVESAIATQLDVARFPANLTSLIRELQALAREMLSYSISFIESLSTFMTSTYTRLVTSGFSKKNSWDLVSKLVHRILFAKDCFAVRGKVSEHLDANHKKTMAVGVIWATLATHQVLKEYMAHGIENHPSIASEYVRFLVAHSGLTRLDKLEVRVLKLEENMRKVLVDSAYARKTADQAQTKAVEAMKEAKKR
jgi:hypothetical protein